MRFLCCISVYNVSGYIAEPDWEAESESEHRYGV